MRHRSAFRFSTALLFAAVAVLASSAPAQAATQRIDDARLPITDATETRDRAATCLADAIYYEAANQSLEGRRAVAQVVLNRLNDPHYPKSVCGVVYQGAHARGCQFTFACDGSLARAVDPFARHEAQALAEQALEGGIESAVGGSTHYHTIWVHPYWSGSLTPTVRIGAHQFYRPTGGRVSAAAFAATGVRESVTTAPAAPQPSRFSIWGLEVATLSARQGEVSVAAALAAP